LCDSIALIHISKKILDGKVSYIKNLYLSHTYRIGFSGQLNGSENEMFTIIEQKYDEGLTHLTVKVNDKYSANDLLNLFIPQVQVNEFMEVIPSMNDIFIQNVKN